MQLSIMNKVKSGELSIEDALNQARKDEKKQKADEVPAFQTELLQYCVGCNCKALTLM